MDGQSGPEAASWRARSTDHRVVAAAGASLHRHCHGTPTKLELIRDIAAGILLALALVLAIPVATLALQVASAVRGRRAGTSGRQPTATPRPSIAVLMPAHDEQAGIAASIAAVLAQLQGTDRLLVIADNCIDETAAVARAAGADVVERHDPARRGKGYALDRGVSELAAAPPAVAVIVDADCIVAAGAIERIARLSDDSSRPVQALYLMRAPAGAPLGTRIAELAWLLKNQLRASGFHRLGLPCQLMGSGMAFPWAAIRGARLASGQIVEDLQLGLELAANGQAPLFCPEALVSSVFPSSVSGLASQRTRWEHGHLGVIADMAPRLLWQAIVGRRFALAALVFDLCVPPLAGLMMALALVAFAAAALVLTGGSTAPLLVAAATLLGLAATLTAAWRAAGRGVVTASELASVPAYVLRKIPSYLRLARRRQSEWVRTERDDAPR